MYEVIYDKKGKNSCINLLPVPGKLRCQDVACSLLASCLGVLARIPSINFRFQGLTCVFSSGIPENRAPTRTSRGRQTLIRP